MWWRASRIAAVKASGASASGAVAGSVAGAGAGSAADAWSPVSDEARTGTAPRLEIISTTTAASTNDAVSTTNAVPVPTTAIMAPAIGGPMIEVSCSVPWSRAFADGSRSPSTTRGRNACWAGR